MTNWTSEAVTAEGVTERCFAQIGGVRPIFGVVWKPSQQSRCPLVLLGHGGTSHALASATREWATRLVREGRFAVMAIDGPVHGRRRADGGGDSSAVIGEFRSYWHKADGGRAGMAQDWSRALDFALSMNEVDSNSIGYFGVSMGTAYGIPLCAAETRIKAAVLGSWALDYPNSAQLRTSAEAMQQPTLFVQKWHDELMSRTGQMALFDAVGARIKQLNVYPGRHSDPCVPLRDDALRFLVRTLASPLQPGD